MDVVRIKPQEGIFPIEPDRLEGELRKLNPKLPSRLRRLLAEVIAFIYQMDEKVEPVQTDTQRVRDEGDFMVDNR